MYVGVVQLGGAALLIGLAFVTPQFMKWLYKREQLKAFEFAVSDLFWCTAAAFASALIAGIDAVLFFGAQWWVALLVVVFWFFAMWAWYLNYRRGH